MGYAKPTMADVRREAIRHYAQKSPLYYDILADFSSIDEWLLVEIVQRELMRRIVYTSSRYEHLVEEIGEL